MVGYNFQSFLPWESIIPAESTKGAAVLGFLVFFSYAIVMNTFVPISLYVSVEVRQIKSQIQVIVSGILINF